MIRTTIDNVCTLLNDSGLGHSYWAEAAAYSIDTCNLVPSCQHPGLIPAESFLGKGQHITHLCVFGARCWAKIPTVLGGSKLDQLLGYISGSGNYKVLDVTSHQVFVSRDVVFEEGHPHCTSAAVGEETQIPFFDILLDMNMTTPPADDAGSAPATNVPDLHHVSDQADVDQMIDKHIISAEPHCSNRTPQPSQAGLQSLEYKRHEITERDEGNEWATDCRRPQASFTID